MSRRIRDISQRLHPGLPVWPGDTTFVQARTWRMEDGSPVNVSALTLSTHSGAHADAPLHYAQGASDIAGVDLDPYVGECLVVDARGAGRLIEVGDIPPLQGAERVLFRTFERFPQEQWAGETTALAPGTIEWLAGQGVRLVGIDGPSIDPQDSKDMLAHKTVLKHDLRVLEGLVLDGVEEGRYELIALPLPIVGGDASPVRAVLRDLA
ncbi:arylformamidase [Erythrobacter sp. HL-111]|uniref:arylformamidase n=1 Tax=Erythrobacter sp. HL-111 TaxID=1798193 RepID=UPI0006D9C467|nr:arylformamidase [Erythrobacter sp. HL-111]KPP94085.1 MAG: arylformamidase [Erythrobacteraceae bacterium HL-111]SDS61521.1 Kynurenine formamidase [Erythrobacter sp. HL-111]